MNIKQDLRDRLITGTFAIGQGCKEPTNWKTYAEDLELEYERLAVENQSLLINSRNHSIASSEQADNFAISFAVWCLYDPDAQALQVAKATAHQLLERYKSRPFINYNSTEQQ